LKKDKKIALVLVVSFQVLGLYEIFAIPRTFYFFGEVALRIYTLI
jgi:hypothetical protein